MARPIKIDGHLSVRFEIRFTPEEKLAIAKAAEQAGVSAGSWLRLAAREALRKQSGNATHE